MKTAGTVSPDKLRGGFYSPGRLVQVCLDRIAALTDQDIGLRVLEPSAGDGAFIRGLSQHHLAPRVAELTAVEISPAEAARCAAALDQAPFEGRAIAGNVLTGALPPGQYDAAVGNPPFVRFQFLGPADRAGALAVAGGSGLRLGGVANLWLPVLLSALTRLRPGGAFAFIVPAECFTGISARSIRTWLLGQTESLQADLFPPGSFPGVLQEVVIISGRISRSRAERAAAALRVAEHAGPGPAAWTHEAQAVAPTWTRYLLRPGQLAALSELTGLAGFRPLGDVARLSVSTVTGANDYFCVTDQTRLTFALDPWSRPLLPRVRRAAGLRFGQRDHEALAGSGSARWLLSFAAGLPSPEDDPAARRYLDQGAALGLPRRYKCRIRAPWYRVPVVRPGRMLLSKRSHRYPRLILNEAAVVTTDTIYQGTMTGSGAGREDDLVAGFHNSATLLTAEIEGRSFGGGVLELVPTEISRLAVPLVPRLGASLEILDQAARAAGPDSAELVERTDALLLDAIPALRPALLDTVRDARLDLMQRRLDRN